MSVLNWPPKCTWNPGLLAGHRPARLPWGKHVLLWAPCLCQGPLLKTLVPVNTHGKAEAAEVNMVWPWGQGDPVSTCPSLPRLLCACFNWFNKLWSEPLRTVQSDYVNLEATLYQVTFSRTGSSEVCGKAEARASPQRMLAALGGHQPRIPKFSDIFQKLGKSWFPCQISQVLNVDNLFKILNICSDHIKIYMTHHQFAPAVASEYVPPVLEPQSVMWSVSGKRKIP